MVAVRLGMELSYPKLKLILYTLENLLQGEVFKSNYILQGLNWLKKRFLSSHYENNYSRKKRFGILDDYENNV